MMEPTSAVPGIFISYRREDIGYLADLLYEQLAERFGEDQVFMDLPSIGAGADFIREIEHVVGGCQVLLAVIGPGWLTATDKEGRRRLDDSDDLVRLEIEAALERDIHVVPVLVDGTRMPSEQELPDTLAKLARRNARTLSRQTRSSDVSQLSTAVQKMLEAPAIPRELADLNRAIELEPNNAWARTQRGAIYRKLKQFDQALADFDRALELEPNNASALRHRGLTYRMTGRKDLALADFDRAVQLEPDNAWGFWERGTTRYALKPTEDALADFDRALELEPNSASALRHRGSFWRKQGRYDKALADLDRALTLEPNSAWAYTERGATYRALEHYEEALADLDRAVDLDPTYAWALRERAAIRQQSR